MDMTLFTGAGLDTKTGIEYTGGEDKYVSAVQRFYKNYEKNSGKVKEYHAAKDYESYMITVHALKSNSKMIGASDLSGMFEELEMAARAGDTAVIDSKTEDVLGAYADLIEKLKPLGDMGEIRAADEISCAEALDTADKLLAALDDFDDELSKELVNKLSGYPFRITQRDLLNKAGSFIDDFMYDEAAEIIKEIYPDIE